MTSSEATPWQGRSDQPTEGPTAVRWHQAVVHGVAAGPPGIALVGFACDEGVRRNQGRVGASAGPRALRAALANLAWHGLSRVYDAGDISCDGEQLEEAHERLAHRVAELIRLRHRPLVLGGGHETAWGSYLGWRRAHPTARLGIINIDAHFDLRPAPAPHSGTPFLQMAEDHQARGLPFRYLCIGVAECANTVALFDRARSLGVAWHADDHVDRWTADELAAALDPFLRESDAVYLSVDLDALQSAVMPAVSAPAIRGLSLDCVTRVIDHVARSGRLALADVVELNPTYDQDGRGARVAAGLVWRIARHWQAEAK